MTHTAPAAGTALPSAAAHAAEAEELIRGLYSPGQNINHTLGRGFAALTHGLLTVAAAVQAAGNDTGDALCDLDSQLAYIDDTLTEVATEIAGRGRARPRRWPWRRQPAVPVLEGTGDGPCDNTSVGVIIAAGGRYLVFERNTPPAGVAPCAGHVDGHGGFELAAHAEVTEELGLAVTSLRQVTGGWRPNRCRRQPGPAGPGHAWAVYLAQTRGQVRPSARETRSARWLDSGLLQVLADRTAAYAYGRLTSAEFAADPGIEPVWVQWLADAGIIHAGAADLAVIGQLAGEPR